MDLQNAKNVFPLNLLGQHYDKYFIDASGNVYSTKISVYGRKMYGNGAGHVTMNNMSVSKADILRRAKQHAKWTEHTSPASLAVAKVAVDVPVKGKSTARHHAKTVDEGLKGRGVVIARVGTHDGVEHLIFGSKPAIHMTQASYEDEMQRLALQYPGVVFVAVKVVKTVKAAGIVWG